MSPAACNDPSFGILYDLYHSVTEGEDPATELANAGGLVNYVQIADAPGRGEPGSGDLDWAAQLAVLRASGYDGPHRARVLPDRRVGGLGGPHPGGRGRDEAHPGRDRRRRTGGLMLSHLLHRPASTPVVIDNRTREEIEDTIRAGSARAEHGRPDDATPASATGCSARARTPRHRLRFGGASHRIDLHALRGGRAVTVYAQHEVLKDLIAHAARDGGDVRFGVDDGGCREVDGDRTTIRFTARRRGQELRCDFVVGVRRLTDATPGP